MGFLDNLMKKAEELGNQKVEEINKRLAAIQKNTTSAPFELLPKTEKPKKPKPDLSIEGISKQIIKLKDSMLRNGFKEYEIICNRSCCEICKQFNGKHFKLSDFEIGVNAPPFHEKCCCSIAAYEDRAEYEKWLNSF